MTTSTSLNLRAVLKTAVARSGMAASARAVSGLTPSAKALYVAGTAQALPARCRPVRRAGRRRPRGDRAPTSAFFLAALEGLPQAALERAVLSVSVARSRSLSRTGAAHRRDVGARAGPARASRSGPARVVIASAAALLPRVSRARATAGAALELKPGQDIAPTDLAELLVDAGFTREDPADEHGEFAVRGGIVDIFPAGDAHPVRLEFIGDTIETMRTYDPSTQRSIAPIDQVAIVPLRDVLDDDRRRDALRLPGAGTRVLAIIVSERDEVDAHVVKLLEQLQQSYDRCRAATAPAVPVPPPSELFASLGTRSNRGWPAPHSWRCSASTDARAGDAGDAASAAIAMSAGGGTAKAASPTGLPEIRRLRDEGETTLFVAATHGPRRADDRAAQGIRRLRDPGRARRRRALRGGAGRGRQPVARLSAARRGPADLRRSGRLRGGAPRARAAPLRRRRRSSPTCATSRSATSSSTSITASACSSA